MQNQPNTEVKITETMEQLMLKLLRVVLRGESFTRVLTFEEFKVLFRFAVRHDLSHFVYVALQQTKCLPIANDDAEREFLLAARDMVEAAQYRYVKLEAEIEHIGAVLEREGIDYMPLKGAVMRVMYPEPWLRTSCDVDVLVRESDLDRAVDALVAEGFTTDGERNYHDVVLCCDDVTLELHHNLCVRMPKADTILQTAWENTVSRGHYHLETPAFFLYHHIAHMAHHVVCGGCGIRTVMDLWLLLHNSQYPAKEVLELCRQSGLDVFAEQVCQLAEIWFGDTPYDEQIRPLERYILNGGVFGCQSQRYASSAARHGKNGTALRVMFMPYEDLRYVYPQLDGKPYLTFYYQCRRIITRLRQGRGGDAFNRIKQIGRQDADTVTDMQMFLSSLGLQEVTEEVRQTMNGAQMLMAILRSLLQDTPLSFSPTFEEFHEGYRQAKHHDLAHFVYYVLKQQGKLPQAQTDQQRNILAKAEKQLIRVQYRYARTDAELAHLHEVFVDAGIAHMPLKGAVLCALYPEPWMRTRCDIDMLIHNEDFDRALDRLIQEGYVLNGERNFHEITLVCSDVHLELHHSITERHADMDVLLEQVWDHAESDGLLYRETPDFFRFHHIAHMAHHFMLGGCGVRTVLDLWLLRHAPDHHEDGVRALCEQAKLLTFYDTVCRLSDIWFGDKEHDEVTAACADFILSGGTYGTQKQRDSGIAVQSGRVGTAWKMLCPPYADMVKLYPQLSERKWLTPWYRLRRLFSRLHPTTVNTTLKNIQKLPVGKELDDVKQLMNALEL